jgi:zinc protease
VGTAFDHPGLLSIGMGTKSGTTAAAIEALLLEIDAFQKNPSTPEELARAKDNLLNSFIFRFDSKEKVLAEKMSYAFYGYPADFLERYRAGIERVTADDVARAAREYIHRDRLAILVVGKAADFEKPLSTFGKVQEIDIAIPEAPGEKVGK